MEVLRKGTDSEEFPSIRPRLCGNYAIQQNFHTSKLCEISILRSGSYPNIWKLRKIVHSRAYLFYLFSYQNVDLARQEIVNVRGSIKRSFFELSKWSKGITIKKSTLSPIIKTIEGNNFNATRVTKRYKLTIFFQTNKSKMMIVKRETRAIDWSLKAYLIIGSS